MFIMKVGTLIQLWKSGDATHVASGTDWCTKIVRSTTPQHLKNKLPILIHFSRNDHLTLNGNLPSYQLNVT